MRDKFHWRVRVQSEQGRVEDRTVSAYWDPGFEGIEEIVGITAAVEAYMETKPRERFVPVMVALVT